MAAKRGQLAPSGMARGAVAPDRRPLRRGWHGVADAFIGLETASALYWERRCEPKFSAGPQIRLERAIGGAGGDALSGEE